MKCLICYNDFNEKRCLKDLFRTKNYLICNSCLKKYPFKIERSILPLDKYNLEIISLFEKDKRINYDAFIYEFSAIYKRLCELDEGKVIIFSNKVYINEEMLENYNQISHLLDKEIVILTNVLFV